MIKKGEQIKIVAWPFYISFLYFFIWLGKNPILCEINSTSCFPSTLNGFVYGLHPRWGFMSEGLYLYPITAPSVSQVIWSIPSIIVIIGSAVFGCFLSGQNVSIKSVLFYFVYYCIILLIIVIIVILLIMLIICLSIVCLIICLMICLLCLILCLSCLAII